MPLAEICALLVEDIAYDDCKLFLFGQSLFEAIACDLEAKGATVRTRPGQSTKLDNS
jgi:hypothetical protein